MQTSFYLFFLVLVVPCCVFTMCCLNMFHFHIPMNMNSLKKSILMMFWVACSELVLLYSSQMCKKAFSWADMCSALKRSLLVYIGTMLYISPWCGNQLSIVEVLYLIPALPLNVEWCWCQEKEHIYYIIKLITSAATIQECERTLSDNRNIFL